MTTGIGHGVQPPVGSTNWLHPLLKEVRRPRAIPILVAIDVTEMAYTHAPDLAAARGVCGTLHRRRPLGDA